MADGDRSHLATGISPVEIVAKRSNDPPLRCLTVLRFIPNCYPSVILFQNGESIRSVSDLNLPIMAAVHTTYGRARSVSLPRGGHLNFRVVSCSSFTEQFPPDNLSTPGSSGWISEEFPSYPVDIVVELSSTSVMESLQLFSHQYLIPSLVDIATVDDDELVSGIDISTTEGEPVAQFRFSDDGTDVWPTDSLVKEVKFEPPLLARLLQISCHCPLSSPYNQLDQVGINSLHIGGRNTETSMAVVLSQINVHHPNRYSVLPAPQIRYPYLPNVRPRSFREPPNASRYPQTRKSRGPLNFGPTISQIFRYLPKLSFLT
ncbi:hypothetical protein RvY_10666-2 [Ramazzottius varieornatus]|uniref:Centrosomal protein CEP104 N-terminal domain-containing protein n=1 Tax=Ramazzottius varieornatus TaxID=947166 RepID=A0A1D1VIW7_RAMVA|nr:hypothetical protein RvY_10666-2 [Ramazzottius varieornatus]